MKQRLQTLRAHILNCQFILLLLSTSAFAQPTITSFTPSSGPVGTTVTINGTGFNATPSNNIVYFGATRATVTAATTTQLTMTVPVGATYQPISVLVNGLLAYSKAPFVTTYPGWGAIDANSFIPNTNIATVLGYAVSTGDFDGDGKIDLAVVCYATSKVSIFRNTSTGAGAVSYGLGVDFATGSGPAAIAIGDLDGDGKADVATANGPGNTVSVLRNTSSGAGVISYSAKVDFVSGAAPNSISIGDLDGDGKADIVTSNQVDYTISILRNTGSVGVISFATRVNKTTGLVPWSVAIGDMDGDGKADLVVANEGSNTVSTFRNTSTGAGVISYANKVDKAIGTPPVSVSIGDLDGDGKADLATANRYINTVSILRNTSTGAGVISYANKVDKATGTSPGSISIGDLDGDGKADLAVASNGSGSVSTFKNTSTGAGVTSFGTKVDYAVSTNAGSNVVSIADLDGDGKSDLILLTGNNGLVSMILHVRGARQTITFSPISLKNYNDAPFTLSATTSSGLPLSYTSSNPAVATVSGNTATIIGMGATVITASQAGDNNFAPAISVSQTLIVKGPKPIITSYSPTSGPIGTPVTITGSNFDAIPENNVVFFGAVRAPVTSGTTTQLIVTVPAGATNQPISVLTNVAYGLVGTSKAPFSATYNGDVTINEYSFNPRIDLPTTTDIPQSAIMTDLDADGKPDIALCAGGSNIISVLRNTSTGIGSLSYDPKIDFTLPSGAYPLQITYGDMDGDGKPDLLVANQNANNVSILRNTSGGPGSISFAAAINITAGNIPTSITLSDFDLDGKLDMAVTNLNSNNLFVFRNTSTGAGVISFATRLSYATPVSPRCVSAGDFNNDGKVDIVLTSSGNISFFRNTSSAVGLISFATRFDLGNQSTSIAVGDLDMDGKIDIASTDGVTISISILKNKSVDGGSFSFDEYRYFNLSGAIKSTQSVSMADFNGDGKLDLATLSVSIFNLPANYRNYKISILRNTSNASGSIDFSDNVDFLTSNSNSGVFIGSDANHLALGDMDGDGRPEIVIANATNQPIISVFGHSQKLTQSITFNSLPQKTFGDTPFALSASSSSGLPISYSSSNPSVATINGNTVTITGKGVTIISATQAGDGTYSPASITSQNLIVGPLPSITFFSPDRGPVGTIVTISGSNFDAVPASNKIYFGETKAMVLSSSSTQLTVKVPSGASYKPISLTVNGFHTSSKVPFLPTYDGNSILDATSFLPKNDFSTNVPSPSNAPYAALIGDLNQDGKSDISISKDGSISALQNTAGANGTVSFGPDKNLFGTGAPYNGIVKLGRFDRDEDPDLALRGSDGRVVIFENSSTLEGAIDFNTYTSASNIQCRSFSVGDFDNDGLDDLVTTSLVSPITSQYSSLDVLRNTTTLGKYTFASQLIFVNDRSLSPGTIYSATPIDIDGDGKLDLVVIYESGIISLYRNISSGIGSINFAPKVDIVTGGGLRNTGIGDFDNDGKVDIAITNTQGGTIDILRNLSSGLGSLQLGPKVSFPALSGADRTISIGDLDGDGKVDIAYVNESVNYVSVIRNLSTGIGNINFSPKVDFVTGDRPYSVDIGDLNGDGAPEIAVANATSKTISIFQHKSPQSISFNPLPSKVFGDAPFALSATASSGLPITYSSSNTSVATISGNMVTIVGEGSTTITASQAGNANVSAAASVSQPLKIGNKQDLWTFQYKYDGRRRMTHKKVPGAEWVYMVYDNRDRLVLTQDGEQRKSHKWNYTLYDALNRPIITGIYTHTSPLDQAAMSGLISTTNFYEAFDVNQTSNHGYTNSVLAAPNFVAANFEVLTVTYYDNYLFKSLFNNPLNEYAPGLLPDQTSLTGIYPQEAAFNDRVIGQVTGNKVKVLNSSGNVYLLNVSYYDNKYRPIQQISDNQLGGKDRSTSIYDFAGKVMATMTTHNLPASDKYATRTFTYDHAGRLLKTWHSLNGAAPVLLAQNEYNELGQLVTKNLHNTDPVATADASRVYKQNVDYRYNIRGWLTKVNDATTPTPGDFFSMNLNYNTPNTNGVVAQFNGNISEIQWRSIDTQNNSYGCSYDAMNRLTEAKYYTTNTLKNGRFNEKIWDTANGKSGYDLNGNIKYLSRAGKIGMDGLGITTYGTMDNLSYAYQGNQLLKVDDSSIKTEGFKEAATMGNDYNYDANGNMVIDQNKDIITSTGMEGITYNHLNLPAKVTKRNGDYIKYIYDASGRKLKQEVYKAGQTTPEKVTDYVGEYIYENNVLQFINHEEGRITMTGAAPEYQYHLKDHLGNVRVTFTSKADEAEVSKATIEPSNEASEMSKFLNTSKQRKIRSRLLDHTYDGVTPPGDGAVAVRLSGAVNEKVGLAKSLAVMPGDKIDIEVYAKYIDGTATDNAAYLALLANIASNGIVPAGTVIDGSGYATAGSATYPFTGYLDQSPAAVGPKAYLNYVVFDHDFVFKTGGFKRVSTAAHEQTDLNAHPGLDFEGSGHELLTFTGPEQIQITEAGFVYIWLSNEEPQSAPVEVYFDDFKVTHIKSPVIESSDYYPFGLVSQNSSRENSVPNQYKYNGKELQDELNLGWLDYGARMYQPELGRFFTQDRYAEKYYGLNPYQYTANNPVMYVDMNGDSIIINFVQGGGKKGRDLIEIKVTGKVVDKTTNGLSSKQLNRIAGQLTKQIEKSFSGKDSNVEFNATADITAEDAASNPLAAGDHAFNIVDDVATEIGSTAAPGTQIDGYAAPGQNYVYIDQKSQNKSRTGTHELGHSAGLGHPKSEINPATGAPYGTNALQGNLMHQSQDTNSSGQPVAGTRVEGFQVQKIQQLYGIGALNRGKQKK